MKYNDLLKLQKLVVANSPNKLVFNEKTLIIEAKKIVNNDMRIINDCVKLVNTTINPDVYFSRYDLLLEQLQHLILFEPYLSFSGESPTQSYKKILSYQEKSNMDFLERYYMSVIEKAKTLKTDKAKNNRIKKFQESLEPYFDKLTPSQCYFVKSKDTIHNTGSKLHGEISQIEKTNNQKKSLVSLTCPSCGSPLEVNSTDIKVKCKYCGTSTLIENFITERRIDKADTIKSLKDMIVNAINNNDYSKAYNYCEEVCKLDSADENLAYLNIYGFLSSKIDFNSTLLQELYSLSPDKHREVLDKIFTEIKLRKQVELNRAAKIINKELRNAELRKINKKYSTLFQQINTEIKKMKKKACKCGHMLEYNETICSKCGLNYSDYQAELAREKSAKNKKMIKLSLIICVPLVISVVMIAFVYNSILINNINSSIDNKDYLIAEQLIDSYQQSNPSRLDVYQLYADLYLAQNEPEKAIEKLQEGISRVYSSDKEELQILIDKITNDYALSDKEK
ncbi:MAG: hypothetical protein U0L20_06390 [Ruminococcus sp.]|nr:hypothetical protein [Ruminococcus sp.]